MSGVSELAELPELHCALGSASAERFVESTGTHCALLGNELGVFELWIWPLKIAHELEPVAARHAQIHHRQLG